MQRYNIKKAKTIAGRGTIMKWIMIIMIGIMKGIMECDKAQKKP